MNFLYVICAVPGQMRQPLPKGMERAHMAWQIGSSLCLKEGRILASTRGGYMVLGDALYDMSPGDTCKLADRVWQECISRGFTGLICDFEQGFSGELEGFVNECVRVLRNRGIGVFVPEAYAECNPNTRVFIPTAMSSGSLSTRLKESVARYGNGRVVLEMERLRRDIILPSPSGIGRAMRPGELEQLLSKRAGSTFFSQEMCSRYLTYKDEQDNTHFVLYDDAGSFAKKTQLAQTFGINMAFVLYPEIESFLHLLK